MAAPSVNNTPPLLECIHFAKNSLGVEVILKPKQLAALKAAYDGRDCVAVLPTGYGKSLIYQLLPWFLQHRHQTERPMITLVVSPLNSIMQDQVGGLVEKGVKACFLNVAGSGGTTYEVITGDKEMAEDDPESEEDAQVSVFTEKNVSLASIRKGDFSIIYAHPETLVSNREVGRILRSPVYQKWTGCVAVDEVHMVAEWGEDFRKDFQKLADLNAVFPEAVHLAVTATLTPAAIRNITETLQLENPVVLDVNPDRPNIYLQIKTRLPNLHKYDKYDDIIEPLFQELKEKKSTFPVTIVYVDDLEALGYFYRYLEDKLGIEAYVHGKPAVPEYRLFAQYHKDYTDQMKLLIVKELRKTDPVVRLVLATVALGMGLDAPSIMRIIHSRPPTSLEQYMQEIGRAGRKGQPASALMYYNNNDIAKNRAGLSKAIPEFCRNVSTCLRRQLLLHFGFHSVLYQGPPDGCCSNCKAMYVISSS